jgi:hypothetical protein
MKWIERLETTNEKQGKGLLCRVNDDNSKEYCCLGILCEVAKENDIAIEVGVYNGRVTYDHKTALPPQEVLDWLGVPKGATNVLVRTDDNKEETASWLNDGCSYSFPEIAASLRKTYLPKTETPVVEETKPEVAQNG